MKTVNGTGVSLGYATGRAVIITECDIDFSHAKFTSAEEEMRKFESASKIYTKETARLIESLSERAGKYNSDILNGHLMMLSDPYMLTRVHEFIDNGKTAMQAVDLVCKSFYDIFDAFTDEVLRQRASDIIDVRNRLLEIMGGRRSFLLEDVPRGSILIAEDFTPSMTSRINQNNVSAIISVTGSHTSHSAILARAMGIPAVFGVKDALSEITDGIFLAVDGTHGKILLEPDSETLAEYEKLRKEHAAETTALSEYLDRETITLSGQKKTVCGNIGRSEDASGVLENGGEGIGLFRTEYLFMNRSSLPDEDEQFEAYSAVAKAMGERQVIIRTLDIGGDKTADYLHIPKEDNPLLGYRAIRYSLDNPEIFKTQLRAILRAACFGNIKIMLPMITDISEIIYTKTLISECEDYLTKHGIPFKKNIPVGIMIETSAAVIMSDELAEISDFFSIGTNDLTGYVMAADRGNRLVSNFCSVYCPAVLKSIERTILAAKRAGIPVGMCGEAAADPKLIPLLVKWGLDEFSVIPSMIASTRKAICLCE